LGLSRLPEVVIRDLVASDRDQWQPLWQGYLDFYNEPLAAEVTDLTFQRLISSDPSLFGLVALVDGRMVGLTHCVLHRSTWARTTYCYLEDLYVDHKVRGSGLGRTLIEAVYSRADLMECERVYWVTDADNVSAQALYERMATRSNFIQYRR
jgi:ribosomal protein S18 acetylase RimI-like enzyme